MDYGRGLGMSRECLACGDRWPDLPAFGQCPDCGVATRPIEAPATVEYWDAQEALERAARERKWKAFYDDYAVRKLRAELDEWNAQCDVPEPVDGPTPPPPPREPQQNFGRRGGTL